MFGDLQFSFKLAGHHLKNYNNNASRVVFLSTSPNREHFGHPEDSGLLIPIWDWLLNLQTASSELSYWQSKSPTNKDSHHHNPTFKSRVQTDLQKREPEDTRARELLLS